MSDAIETYPVLIEVPIAWGDMDAFQHVNNKVYFKHFESARIAYLEKIDFLNFMAQTGIGPILSATHCRFKMPLTYPDQVTVGAKVDALERDRFNMQYEVFSQRLQKTAAVGAGTIVTFDYRKNRKTDLPAEIRTRILALEQGAGAAPRWQQPV